MSRENRKRLNIKTNFLYKHNIMVEESTDPRMRIGAVGADDDEEPQVAPINFDGMEISDLFHSLESTVVGYDEYENCFEKHYARTIEGLHILVKKI